MSSIEEKLSFKLELSIYSVSKSAVSASTRSLAREYASKGFKINAVVPGGIMTPGFVKLGIRAITRFDFSVVRDAFSFGARMPLKHYGEPDDIARAVLYLAAPISDYLEGHELVADGGGFLSS